MDAIECPYCGTDAVGWSAKAMLYKCRDCGEWFEDDVPSVERVKHLNRTKLTREE